MSDLNSKEELEKRLAAAKAARSEAEAEDPIAALQAKVDQAEREARDAQAIAKARAEHGAVGVKIFPIHTPLGVVIVKRPHPASFKRFQELEKITVEELEQLVAPCRVYPSAVEYDRIIEELPGTVTRLADAVSYLAGARKSEALGKS